MVQVKAVAQIQSMAWELPYAAGVAEKEKKKKAVGLLFHSIDQWISAGVAWPPGDIGQCLHFWSSPLEGATGI